MTKQEIIDIGQRYSDKKMELTKLQTKHSALQDKLAFELDLLRSEYERALNEFRRG